MDEDKSLRWQRSRSVSGSSFFVYRFTTDGEKIAHLPKGVDRQQYGDLLDEYVAVKGYCDKYVIDDLCWNLGHTSICQETTASGSTIVQRKS